MTTRKNGSRGFRHGLPVLLFLAIAILPGLSLAAASPSSAEADVRAYNARALEVQAAFRRGKAVDAQAREVLASRAAALRQLMQSDPAMADRLALPASVLESLSASFPGARSYLEQRGRWSGEFEYLIEDSLDFTTHRS
ncbi:MAG: hypothetical protein EHM60_00195, partial [Lysobacterales bacterium]